jgi:hypothetical protein
MTASHWITSLVSPSARTDAHEATAIKPAAARVVAGQAKWSHATSDSTSCEAVRHSFDGQFNAAGKVVKYDHVTDTAQMIRMAERE